MDNPIAAAALNHLLDAEQQSVVLRVAESTPFISLEEVTVGNIVRAMAQASRIHRAALTELILDLGGQPVPRRAVLLSGNLHYLDLQSMMPQLLQAQESLIALYKHLAPRLASEPGAAQQVNRIHARHEADLARLRAALPAQVIAQPG